MKEKRTYRWQIQTYRGTVTIVCEEDDSHAIAHRLVESKVSYGVPFGPGYRGFTLVRRETVQPMCGKA